MGKYFALIRRTDFTDLFKYGQLHLNISTVVAIEKECKVKDGDDSILNDLFKNANAFESSFTYLVIKFDSEDFSATNSIVNIEEVTNVYPLDYEAKKEFETSFDNHIKIDNPLWSNSYEKIQQLRTKRDCEKGALNLWKLLKPQTAISDCKQIITEDILDEVVSEVYDNRRPSGDLSIWVYLLRYERHAYYPQQVVGYFMDAVNIVCNFLSKHEVDEMAVSQTAVWAFLDEIKKDSPLQVIIDAMEKSEDTMSFITKVSQIENRVEFIKVAVAFLMIKNKYSDGFVYKPEYFRNLAESKITGNYYGLIIYLLGLVWGHDKTYECLYENLPLPIYKSKEEMERIRKQQEYERWKAAEEMRRFEEEQQRQKTEKYKEKGKYGKKGGKSQTYTYPRYDGGDQKPATFREPTPKWSSKPIEPKVEEKPKIESHAAPANQLEPEQPTLFPNNEGITEKLEIPTLPCKMGKLKRGSISEICKTPKPINVNTAEEYERKFNEGWRIINE